jgi:hypothetical protein
MDQYGRTHAYLVIHGRQIFFRGSAISGGVKLVDPIFNGQFFSNFFFNKSGGGPIHSGSSPDINFFFHFFFVLYINFNLSDDVFEGIFFYFFYKMGKIGP